MREGKGRGEGARSAYMYALSLIENSKLNHAGRVTKNRTFVVQCTWAHIHILAHHVTSSIG